MVTFSIIQGLVRLGCCYDYGFPPDLGDSEVTQAGREEISEPGLQLVTGMNYWLWGYVIWPWSFADFELLDG